MVGSSRFAADDLNVERFTGNLAAHSLELDVLDVGVHDEADRLLDEDNCRLKEEQLSLARLDRAADVLRTRVQGRFEFSRLRHFSDSANCGEKSRQNLVCCILNLAFDHAIVGLDVLFAEVDPDRILAGHAHLSKQIPMHGLAEDKRLLEHEKHQALVSLVARQPNQVQDVLVLQLEVIATAVEPHICPIEVKVVFSARNLQ